jgi:hypothetical protein
MLITTRTAARAAAVVVLTGALSALASPAFAAVRRDDGDQPGDTMTWGTALLLFVGIPLVFSGLVWLLVSAPGWTRGGRTGDVDAWTGDPLVLDSDSPAAVTAGTEPTTALGSGDDDAAGGTSARW